LIQHDQPARHERPAIDEAALKAARDADRLLAAARELGSVRWAEFLDGIPDQLRDGSLGDLRSAAIRVRSAYGPKDSIRDTLPEDIAVRFLVDLDRLLKLLAREAMEPASEG
jgi:hypothetical protein